MAKTATPTTTPTPAKVNLFKKAAVAATPTETKKKKQTSWVVDGNANEELKELEDCISTINEVAIEMGTLENRSKLAKTKVAAHAERQFVSAIAATGILPETPMVVSNRTGQSVTYVVQDRSNTAEVGQEQIDMLIDLLGEDAANQWLHRHDVFSFDPNVLVDEIFGPVTDAISEALTKLVAKGTITEDQMNGMISLKGSVKFKPGIVARLGEVCGRDSKKIATMLKILGSASPRYVKA